ncbi:MAG: HlyD family type I secretion periplasmic adaptor subunit [Sedimenticola sp.]
MSHKITWQDRHLVTDTRSRGRLGASPSSHSILWATVIFFILALFWGYYTQLDEITRGEGKVVPSRQMQVVQSLDGGIVQEILVEEGQVVQEGDVLIRIDDTRFASSYREGQFSAEGLNARIARLEAEAGGIAFTPGEQPAEGLSDYLNSELALYNSRKSELDASLSVLNRQQEQKQQEITEHRVRLKQLKKNLELAHDELKITEPLAKARIASEVDVLHLRRAIGEKRLELDATRLAIPRLRSALEEMKSRIDEVQSRFRSEAQEELNRSREKAVQLREANIALEDKVSHTTVRSPVAGIINKMHLTTVGGVVRPGDDLIEVVPMEDNLLIETRIRPKDIAFLRPGQKAKVKVTAYDFSIYGDLTGTLEHISANTIEDERGESFYLIRIRTTQSYFGPESDPLPIIPGMTTSVDILTGKKSVIDYLLKPIKRATALALTER